MSAWSIRSEPQNRDVPQAVVLLTFVREPGSSCTVQVAIASACATHTSDDGISSIWAIRLGGNIRFREVDIDRWIEEQAQRAEQLGAAC